MYESTNILALDIAEKMGVAYTENGYIYTEVVYYKTIKNAYESAKLQLDYILNFPLNTLILIEDFVYFNAIQRRGMNEVIKRFGFIEYSLRNYGYNVQLVHVNATRKKYCIDKPKQKRIPHPKKDGKFKLEGIKAKDWIHQKLCQYSQLTLTNDHTDAILMIMNYENLNYEDIKNKVVLL